jgi:ELWxxDGT repeat protein
LLLKNPIVGQKDVVIQQIVTTPTGKTFFNTADHDNLSSNLWGLWVTDGTVSGSSRLNFPGQGSARIYASGLISLNIDKIVFVANDTAHHGELWATDGTEAGTIELESFTVASSQFSAPLIGGIASLGGIALYRAINSNLHVQLRKTDGTVAGTTLLYDFGVANASDLTSFKEINGILYFELNRIGSEPDELWRSDGTIGGTYMVKNLGIPASGYDYAKIFMPAGNVFYFESFDANSISLWKSDGTGAGTFIVKQISCPFTFDNLATSSAAIKNVFYFTVNDGANGDELWKTDGTHAGTLMLADINKGPGSSSPDNLCALNNVLYFSADDGVSGNELWKYDPAVGVPALVKDIFPGSSGSQPVNLKVQNNTILFFVSEYNNPKFSRELWITDGTSQNTIEIANLGTTGSGISYPLIEVKGNAAYLSADIDFDGDNYNDPGIYKYTAPQKIWTGNVSTDSQDGNNWFPTGVPKQTDNVLLPDNPANSFSNPYLFCNDFINNGSTVNVGSGLVSINGNFYNEGTINNPGVNGYYNGVFAIVTSVGSSVTHLVGNSGTFNGQLTLSGGSNVRLTASSYFPALRVEGADTIYLGDYTLTVDQFNLQSPQIITDGSGGITQIVGASPIVFDVATSGASNTPVTITNYGTQDYFTVSVKNGVFKNGITGDSVTQQTVNKTWNISKQNAGTENANITLQWNASDELPGFNRNNVYLNHYTSGAWDSGTPGIAAGSGPYSFTRNGVTSFSPFSITSSSVVLPVTLLNFSATYSKPDVLIQWQTSQEHNSSHFDIDRAKDGIDFSNIGTLNAAKNSSTTKDYSFTDTKPMPGTNFYRLKMVDADGKFSYSKIVVIKLNDKNSVLQIFPNPAKNTLNIQVNGDNETATLEITDMSGRKVKEEKIQVNGNTSVSFDITNLQKGTYNLLLKSKFMYEQKKFIKE